MPGVSEGGMRLRMLTAVLSFMMLLLQLPGFVFRMSNPFFITEEDKVFCP